MIKSTYVIDIASIRGSENEVKLLNIQHQFDEISDEFNNTPLLVQILAAMIIKIKDEHGEKTNIILYSSCENRHSIDAKIMVDQRFASNNVKAIVGQQSLFYLLGKMSKEIKCVKCISKERLFFSKYFLQNNELIDDEYKYKMYPLFEFEDAVKH